MSWDSVPWMVGGGARHSAEVGRLLAYVSFNGAEGILAPGDLGVRELAVPGTSVRVAPGACAIQCRAAGQTYQAYAGRLPVEDTVEIAATGSGSGRSDLIVARVEDPNLSGEPWDAPNDPAVGPYIFTRVIAGVPSTTTTVTELDLGYSAIPLARIDIPANTATIEQSMITDLRWVANPRRQREILTHLPSTDTTLDSSASNWKPWPSGAVWDVRVPEWASRAVVTATWSQCHANSNALGWADLEIGPIGPEAVKWDNANTTGNYRTTLVAAGNLHVASSLRGTTQQVRMIGRWDQGDGWLQTDAGSAAVVDIEWIEDASLS